MIKLYSKEHIEEIEWDNYRNGTEVSAYFSPLMKEGVKKYIKNIDVDIFILAMDDLLIPISKTNFQPDNSYVVSPYVHYIRYTTEELKELNSPLLEWLLKWMLSILGIILKRGNIDRVIIVNNWFLSTNLYENITNEQVRKIILFLRKEFPNEAIMFRSLTKPLHSSLMKTCQEEGSLFIPSRSIYLFNPNRIHELTRDERKTLRRDEKWINASGYTMMVGIEEKDLLRLVELYNQLYLEKYSYFNPQYTVEFFQNVHKCQLFQFKVIKKNGRIDGFSGCLFRNDVMTPSLFGYDLTLSQNLGLYRITSWLNFYDAFHQNYLLHLSAGAGTFKRNRGAKNEIEYSAVFVDHLPRTRRWVWKTLEILLTNIGIPLLKKYGL